MALVIGLVVAYLTATVEWFIKHDTYTAVSFAFVIPFLLLVPRMLYQLRTVKLPWRAYVEQLGVYVVIANALGTGYFHTIAPQYQYDRLLHFASAFWSVPLFIMFWMVLGKRLPKTRSIIVLSVFVVFFGMFFWEGWQYFSDHVFRSRSFYDARQAINQDFMEDIGFGLLGILCSIPYVRKMMPTYRSFARR